MLKNAGGWVPLPFPDSKYRRGAIIRVTEEGGIRWIGDLESCNFPAEVLKVEKSYILEITLKKWKDFGSNAVINSKGISAVLPFDRVSKVCLELQDHGTDAFRLISLKVGCEDPKNRKKGSSIRMYELKKPDPYLTTEAFGGQGS